MSLYNCLMYQEISILLVSILFCSEAQSCQRICYPKVGCFDKCAPFQNFPLPASPENIDTAFELFTRTNQNQAEVISDTFLGLNFDGARDRTFFILHGFAQSSADEWAVKMKNALLNKYDANVILVDWAWGALPDISRPLDPVPASNSRLVGVQIINIARLAKQQQNLNYKSVHCIGFSVGGQGCGFAGKHLRKSENAMLGRITGLDPAGDIFVMDDKRGRLDKDDAEFVDVLHTNAYGTLISSGTSIVSGHVDFYANKARIQPGCENLGLVEDVCNHIRAHDLFIDSLNNNRCIFYADPCSSVAAVTQGTCRECSPASNNCQEFGMNAINLRPREGIYQFITSKGINDAEFCIPR